MICTMILYLHFPAPCLWNGYWLWNPDLLSLCPRKCVWLCLSFLWQNKEETLLNILCSVGNVHRQFPHLQVWIMYNSVYCEIQYFLQMIQEALFYQNKGGVNILCYIWNVFYVYSSRTLYIDQKWQLGHLYSHINKYHSCHKNIKQHNCLQHW